MGFKGEKVGPYTLDRKERRSLEGELWKARDSERVPVAVCLYYEPTWIQVLRTVSVPEGIPEHPNLSRLITFDLEAHRPWTAWTHVDGRSLREILSHQPYVPLQEAIPLVLQLVRGLEALHAAEIAHHDLRPETVVVTEPGELTLTFAQTEGYRRAVLESVCEPGDRALEELVAAIRPYAAPEQLSGSISGTAGDVYALGTLVYEMLCGSRPDAFAPRYPSERDKRIPKILDEVILGALERRVRARTQDAVGLEKQLLQGFSRAGYDVEPVGAPKGWVRSTPYR
ncbi:protein kinase [Planctomycetota bacterium]